MGNTFLCFFCSDTRRLYKEDVFKAVALPEGHVLHLRYKKKWVDREFSLNPSLAKEKEGVFVYTPAAGIFIEIRKVFVIDAYYEDDTDLIHFFVSLKEIFSGELNDINNTELLPPNKFVSLLNYTTNNNSKWIDKVKNIKQYFGDILYFHIRSLKDKKNKRLEPKHTTSEKESYYLVDEDEQYYMEILYSDYTNGNSKFKCATNEEVIFLNMPAEINVGAVSDGRVYGFITHSIPKPKVPIYLKSSSIDNQETFEIMFKIDVNKKISNSIFFGILSATAVAILSSGQLLIRILDLSDSIMFYGVLLVLIVMMGIVGGFLFYYYDKK